jgi:tripartite-type tricarboxylate transporter receptor subunit TctC
MHPPAVIDTLKQSGMTPNARSGEAFGAYVREDVER